ncbi:hypothetical protein BO78DRAFT_223319 [Aspergillus sclerotiicarbonarius CBS 121057]|uniref:Uncharacterized protein n=1 Tax=Aspergillus sclerotiicarbonarius (strain CBS 121057 / IBT 28362) TaxID=1448318 RepID=A0A319DXC1_ASPSB|nr:hypothetical protein BO78DRAFT_223319 [Aspergillus sclerotiicarbonarius CBS 121057]
MLVSSTDYSSESNQKAIHQVDDVRGMLCEIHEWFTKELKGRTMSASPTSLAMPKWQDERALGLTFPVLLEDHERNDTVAICEAACFSPDWLPEPWVQPASQIFRCHCGAAHNNQLSHRSCTLPGHRVLSIC